MAVVRWIRYRYRTFHTRGEAQARRAA